MQRFLLAIGSFLLAAEHFCLHCNICVWELFCLQFELIWETDFYPVPVLGRIALSLSLSI